MYLKCEYRNENFSVDYYPSFLPIDITSTLYLYLEETLPKSSRRDSILFGDKGIVYTVTYRNETSDRIVESWDMLPGLPELKNLVEKTTGQKYTVCIIQRYPNGNIGIAPHRDKEMVLGTRICGLSLGATRTISFTKINNHAASDTTEPINIALKSGSLYVMNPPTNQKWLHSIKKESKIKEPRISLTFRDYKN